MKRGRRHCADDCITYGLAAVLTVLFCGVTLAHWPGYHLRKFPLVHEHLRVLPVAVAKR